MTASTDRIVGSTTPSPRKVDLDFADAKVHWNPSAPEYCQLLNAISSMLPSLEPFLIKAVRAHKDKLPENQVELRRDVDLFVSQEGRHFRMHARFNKMLDESGYVGLQEREQAIAADFKRFFEVKGPKFSLAYSEGFETFGPVVSSFFFDKAEELMSDWDEPTVYLWLWHFGEEYEHRTVCNYLYRECYDDYLYRLYGLVYASIHLFTFAITVANLLLKHDRQTGRIKNRMASRVRYTLVLTRFFAHFVPRLIGCMRPGYDPGQLKASQRTFEFLEAASFRYGVLEP